MARRNFAAMKPDKLARVEQELRSGGDAAHRSEDVAGDLALVQGLMTERDIAALDGDAPARDRFPFAPQLAQKKNSIAEAVGDKDCVQEPKVDGWRVIVEKRDDHTRAWLRSGDECTHRLPAHVREWTAILPRGTVLDGELAVMHTTDDGGIVSGSSHEVHTLMRRVSKDPDAAGTESLKFMAFDLLRVRNTDLIGEPLRERTDQMRRLLGTAESREVRRLTYDLSLWREHPTEEGMARLVLEGWEGVIVKDLDAKYAPGARGHGVYKLKVDATVDAVVMGVGEGKGEFSGMAGYLTVGQWRDGDLVKRGSVSSGLDFGSRAEIWRDPDAFVGAVVELRHMGNQAGGWRHPVFVGFRADLNGKGVGWHDGR